MKQFKKQPKQHNWNLLFCIIRKIIILLHSYLRYECIRIQFKICRCTSQYVLSWIGKVIGSPEFDRIFLCYVISKCLLWCSEFPIRVWNWFVKRWWRFSQISSNVYFKKSHKILAHNSILQTVKEKVIYIRNNRPYWTHARWVG